MTYRLWWTVGYTCTSEREFAAAKQSAGKEFGCFAGFGASAPYMVAGDVFVFPKTSDKAAIEAQHKLATVFTSPTTPSFRNAEVSEGKVGTCVGTQVKFRGSAPVAYWTSTWFMSPVLPTGPT